MRYQFGDYSLDPAHYELYHVGRLVPIEPRVFDVLAYLVQHAGQTVTTEELLEQLYPHQFAPVARLTNAVTHARKALGDTSQAPRYIQTVRRRGYRFLAPVDTYVSPARDMQPHPAPVPQRQGEIPSPDGVNGETAAAPVSSVRPLAALPTLDTLGGHRAIPQELQIAERRQVTLLLCDLVDSTELAGQFDPEDYHEVLRAYLETCTSVIARCGGTIDTFLGGRALVCFGYPQAQDDAPQQAVRAGLALIEAMAQVNLRLAATWDIQLAVRVGIHTGLVVIEDLAEEESRAGSAIVGEALNIAAHLQELAAPDTVVCSAATAQLVEGYVTLEPLGLQVLKGVATLIPVYRLVSESEAQTRLAVALTRGLTPLVGREPELALLRERWAQAVDGQGQVVVLNGEPGIGKSRLVQELTAHLAGTAHTPLTYYCSFYAQQTAFYPVVTALQRLLRRTPTEPVAEQLHRLEAVLAPYALPLAEAVPLMAALLALPLPTHYPPLVLTPQRQRQKTLEVLVEWILAETQRQSVLCVVEDLHWADPTTLEWLGLLVAQAPSAHLLLLLVCRPEFRLPWPLHAYLTPVTLRRLPPPQVEQLIGQVAYGMPLPRAVVRQIAAKADGVPLFVEELTKTVLEAGEGQVPAEGVVWSGSLPALPIPATLQDSLMARLDRLPAGKVVAQLGATIGRTFTTALLQAVAPLEEVTVQDGLRQLVEAELVYQRGIGLDATYRFKHALIQEAAYYSVLRRARRQYHQRIAQALEAHFPTIVATQPELLAQHCTEAGLIERAVSYWHQAGKQALRRSANVEACHHLQQGLALFTTLPDVSERSHQELLLHLDFGRALMMTRGYSAPEVGATYARAHALCQKIGDPVQLFAVLHGLVLFHWIRAEFPRARTVAEHCLHIAQGSQEPEYLLKVYVMLGQMSFFMGKLTEARTYLEQGLTLYQAQRRQGAPAPPLVQDIGVTGMSVLALTLWWLGYPEQAQQQSRAALAHAHALEHPFSLVEALIMRGPLDSLAYDIPSLQKEIDTALRLAQAQEFPLWFAIGTILRGWVMGMQGHAEDGLTQIDQGLAVLKTASAGITQTYFYAILAEVQARAGHLEAGLRVLRAALALVTHTAERFYEAALYRLQGELLLAQSSEHYAAAETCFQRAMAIASAQHAKAWELRAAMSLARLWQQQGNRAEAYELLAPVYGWFTEGFDTVDLQEAKALLNALGK